jgi:hypothetical protein
MIVAVSELSPWLSLLCTGRWAAHYGWYPVPHGRRANSSVHGCIVFSKRVCQNTTSLLFIIVVCLCTSLRAYPFQCSFIVDFIIHSIRCSDFPSLDSLVRRITSSWCRQFLQVTDLSWFRVADSTHGTILPCASCIGRVFTPSSTLVCLSNSYPLFHSWFSCIAGRLDWPLCWRSCSCVSVR